MSNAELEGDLISSDTVIEYSNFLHRLEYQLTLSHLIKWLKRLSMVGRSVANFQ